MDTASQRAAVPTYASLWDAAIGNLTVAKDFCVEHDAMGSLTQRTVTTKWALEQQLAICDEMEFDRPSCCSTTRTCVSILPSESDRFPALRFSQVYPTILCGVITEADYQAIVSQLNTCCTKYELRIPGFHYAAVIPLLRLTAIALLRMRFQRLCKRLQATCDAISKGYQSMYDLSLKVVANTSHVHVDLVINT